MLTPFVKVKNINVVNKKTHEPTEYDYYIGRPSPLGNPYTHLKSSKVSKHLVATRDEAIESYESYFYDKIKSNDEEFMNALDEIISIYKEYHQVNLVCWCYPKSCHGVYIKKWLESTIKIELIERDGSHVNLNMCDTTKLSSNFKTSGEK